MRGWKASLVTLLAALGAALTGPSALAQEGTQFIGITGYRVGPYGANGAAFFSGFIDYLQLVNERDGGVNGIKLSWEECETEHNNTKGVECYERLKTKVSTGHALSQLSYSPEFFLDDNKRSYPCQYHIDMLAANPVILKNWSAGVVKLVDALDLKSSGT